MSRGGRSDRRGSDHYGVVVESVNVSVLLYEPVRSGSVEFTSWLKPSVTASLDVGPFHVSRFSGEAEEPTLLNAVPVLAALRARACSGCGSTKLPLTRWPVPTEDGSATLSSASPAVEMTFAVVEAVYVLVTPGVNAPKLPGVPSVSDSVAGTVPPTGCVGAAVMAKSAWLTSKKMLPTASTLMRALSAVTCGKVISCEPSLGVEAARTVGKVCPPSVDRLILTLATLIGTTSVPATSHVIVFLVVP